MIKQLKAEKERIEKGCDELFTDKRGINTCGQKDWWKIDLCPKCQQQLSQKAVKE